MIIDTFCLFNELDLLEIRLNILDSHVDKFVVCESRETFSGKPKPLYFELNKYRFDAWKDKIIYITPGNIDDADPFVKAGCQKDRIRFYLDNVCADDDIVYFGDLDEIWKPQDITDDKIYNLRQLNYTYWLNNRSSEEWVGTVVGKWKTFKTNTVNHWRANHDNVLDNGGWHFTNMGGYEQILKKLESYDHALEANIPWVRDNLKERMEKGQDYIGREADWKGKPFTSWLDEKELPQYILDNKQKLQHLWRSK